MARQGKGILGGFRGSVGNLTGNIRKEGSVIKKKQTNSNPTKSISQGTTRNNMALIQYLFKNAQPDWFEGKNYNIPKSKTLRDLFISSNLSSLFPDASLSYLQFFKEGLMLPVFASFQSIWAGQPYMMITCSNFKIPGVGDTVDVRGPIIVYFHPLNKFYFYYFGGWNISSNFNFNIPAECYGGGKYTVLTFKFVKNAPATYSKWFTSEFTALPKP